MKRDNVNYLLVGTFVLAMGAVLLYSLYRITGHTAKGELYHTHFTNVAGIKNGTVVTFEGFEVGNVVQVEPVARDNRTAYRVTLNFRKPLKLPKDSRAMIATPGLLAAPLVEIKEGRSNESIAPGGEIAGVTGGNLMESVASLAADLGQLTETGVKPLLAQVNKRVETIGGSLEQTLPAAMGDLKSTLARLNSAAGRVEALFSAENQQHWNGVLKNANATSADLMKLSRQLHDVRAEVEGLVKDTRTVVGSSGQELQLSLRRADSLLYQLESAGRNLNEFSRSIRENPAALIQNKPPVDAAGETR